MLGYFLYLHCIWYTVDHSVYVCVYRVKSAAGEGGSGSDDVRRWSSVVNDEEDEDVAHERRRVLRGSGRRDLLQLRNLSKVHNYWMTSLFDLAFR